MTSNLNYLGEKILSSDFELEPFVHIYVEDFFKKEHFEEIISCSEINIPVCGDDEELLSKLSERGWSIIPFPGCITDPVEYIKWHGSTKQAEEIHTACEGFGMVYRLRRLENASSILPDIQGYLLGSEFNEMIANKFNIDFKLCRVDCGIQKYLDGYEISPHPDVRAKALTYMVNINPWEYSEYSKYHTHYLKFKDEYKFIQEYWESHPGKDRDWVPWSWCDSVKRQIQNNSLVMFSPANDTIHAVKADYDHLKTQRTQLYGNLWHTGRPKLNAKPSWEQLQKLKV